MSLGWVSFFTDVSSEMIAPFLPLFLSTTLGAGALALGLVEGIADAVSALLKLAAGRWSDRTGRFRPFVLLGYGLSSLARPFTALAAAPWHVVLVRGLDRVGKGVRTSPRDAMIAAVTREEHRGRAYGFQRAMDHAGSVVGPLLAIAIYLWATRDLRTLFALAAIPGAVAVAILFFGLREVPKPPDRSPLRLSGLPDRALVRLLVPIALFSLGNASDLFLLMRVVDEGSGPVEVALLWVGLHAVKSLVSIRAGPLVDRLGPLRLVIGGWVLYVAVYAGFALATSTTAIVGLCLVYGAYHGLTEGAEKALVAAIAPPAQRGAAFGWFHLTVGILALPASLLFGAVWNAYGSSAAFLLGAALAALACTALLALRPGRG